MFGNVQLAEPQACNSPQLMLSVLVQLLCCQDACHMKSCISDHKYSLGGVTAVSGALMLTSHQFAAICTDRCPCNALHSWLQNKLW